MNFSREPQKWDFTVVEVCAVTAGKVVRPLGPRLLSNHGLFCVAPRVRGGMAFPVREEHVPPVLISSVDWAVRGTYRTAWAVAPRCRCPHSYGRGPAVEPQTGRRSWELLRGLWRAVATLMAPWCAPGEVPTSANLNLYGGLFGERGGPKLIVSLSLGSSVLFESKPQARPDSDESSYWLHHGDLLVLDGCCQDEYHHCTDPRLGREWVNVTFSGSGTMFTNVPWDLGSCVACPHA